MVFLPHHNALLNAVYRAAIEPAHWPVVLEGISNLIGSRAATLMYRDNVTKQAGVFHYYNHSPEVIREYIEHYCHHDPTYELAARRAPLGHAIADHQMADGYEEFRALCGTEFNHFLEKSDSEQLCGVVLFNTDQQMSALSLQRSARQAAWSVDELQLLTELSPHFQRALTIHREVSRLRAKNQVMQAGLDKLCMGFILFDELLEPVYCNPIAESILAAHEAIRMHDGVVRASQPEQSAAIREGLQEAAKMEAADEEPDRFATALGLTSPGNPPLPVFIVPVRQSAMVPMRRFRHAHVAMLLSDPARNQPIVPEALQCAYGLTATEACVAIAVANGMGVREIARSRDVQPNTVKTHLKSIYAKLRVRRQSELTKTILNGPFRVAF